MDKFELLTDNLSHNFPLNKTRGLRSSQCSLSQQEQQSFPLDQISQFPTQKHRTKIPYMTFKPKTQFVTSKHPYEFYQEYKSLSKGSFIQISSVLKQQNTAMNSIVSSGIKQPINYQNRFHEARVDKELQFSKNKNSKGPQNSKQLSYCISPIKIDDGSVMTPVDKQMINILSKLADRMNRLEEKQNRKSKQKSNKSRVQNKKRKKQIKNLDQSVLSKSSESSSQNIQRQEITLNMNNSKHLKQQKYSYSQANSINAVESKHPQIVINNIIKGKSDMSENNRSRIYDLMDYQLRKQQDIIRKLQIQRHQSKNRRKKYRTPQVTQFSITQIQKQKERLRIDEKHQNKQNLIKNNSIKNRGKRQEETESQYSRINVDTQDIFISQINKKISLNPSQSSGNIDYVQSQSSRQNHFQINKNPKIRHRNFVQTQQQVNHIQIPTPPESITQPIEIEIKKPISFEFPNDLKFSGKQNVSLAEAFQKRRQNMNSQRPKQTQVRRQKSKQQLAEIRKNMMKRRPTQSSKPQSIQATIIDSANTSMKLSKRQPSKQLLDRLINGTKGPIDKKQMRALTQKNYQQLPEVRQKKEQMRKRQELQKRMIQKREYDRSIRKAR